MDAELVVRLGREALTVTLLVAGPLLLVTTLVGLGVAILQATTQINEQSLTFVPKVLAVMLAGALLAPWMLARLTDYAARLLAELPRWIR